MKTKTKNEEIEKFKKLYGIKDTDIVLRLWGIKTKLENEKNIIMSNEELFSFINDAMNYDEMQIWLLEKSFEGIQLSFNDKLKKFFELKTDEYILISFDVLQNYNDNNIENVKKLINSK